MNLKLEDFICKSVQKLTPFGEFHKVNDDLKEVFTLLKNKKTFILKPVTEFCGKTYERLEINLDDNQMVKDISTAFPEIVDRIFYDKMIKYYGVPSNILAYDKLISESKSNDFGAGSFNQNLSKRSFSLKEASFDEKPVFIIWKKEYYDIKMMFYYKEKITGLTFRKQKEGLF